MTPRVILLDRGHGGDDPGAVCGHIREAELNTAVTKELFRLLAADGNYQPLLACPYEVEGLFPLDRRVEAAAAAKPDLLLSNHFNAGGGTGFEVYPEVPRASDHPRFEIHRRALGFARILASEMEGLLPLRGDKGVQYRFLNGDAYYGIIRRTPCPALLIENAFVDSTADMAKVGAPEGLADIARRQYRAVCRFFGTVPVSLAEEETPAGAGGSSQENDGMSWQVLIPAGVFASWEEALEHARQQAPQGFVISGQKSKNPT